MHLALMRFVIGRPPLLKVDAEQTLAGLKRDGRMDGFIRPYPEESEASKS
jgi:hypothetical protein